MKRLNNNTEIEIWGQRMFINPNDTVISKELIGHKVWEPLETKIIQENIKAGMTCIDIGAHIGYYTLLMSKLVGDRGKVYAFEPDPTNYKLLRQNIDANGIQNVVAEQKAVWKKKDKIKLYLSPDNTGDHRIYQANVQPHPTNRQEVEVEAIRLDTYFAKIDSKINFIKMDIQGAECQALTGARRILSDNKDLKITTEYWTEGLEGAGTSAKEFIELLEWYKFKIYVLNKIKNKVEEKGKEEIINLFPPQKHKIERHADLFCVKENGIEKEVKE